MSAQNVELEQFLATWTQDPLKMKQTFLAWQDFLRKQDGVSFAFKARPGVSYSLRAKHQAQTERELFVLIDVVDDEPENRWLSVCFYADFVTDPDDLADFVPQGLMGEDARCFNLDTDDETMRNYIQLRLHEAVRNAANKNFPS